MYILYFTVKKFSVEYFVVACGKPCGKMLRSLKKTLRKDFPASQGSLTERCSCKKQLAENFFLLAEDIALVSEIPISLRFPIKFWLLQAFRNTQDHTGKRPRLLRCM